MEREKKAINKLNEKRKKRQQEEDERKKNIYSNYFVLKGITTKSTEEKGEEMKSS